MKRFLTLALPVLAVLLTLSGCAGCDGGEKIDYNLVFVNGSDAKIVEVVVDFQDRNSGTRNADSSPLKRGDSFGFEVGEYPATVYVYDKVADEVVPGAVAQLTIPQAPPEGERWYVTARDGAGGLEFTVDTQWPEGV